MADNESMVQSMKEEWSDMRERAGDMLHGIWPFRSEDGNNEGEDAHRKTMPFSADVFETAEDFVLVGEVPGVSRKDLEIQVTDTELSITGKLQVGLDQDERVILGEIPGADYQRVFTLSDAVDRDQVRAELSDGIMTVRLAKSSRILPRQITISD